MYRRCTEGVQKVYRRMYRRMYGRLGDPGDVRQLNGDVRQLKGVQKQRVGTAEHVEHRFDAKRHGKFKRGEVADTQKTVRKRSA